MALEFDILLADLLWIEYKELSNDARAAYVEGDNLKALALAILAHKVNTRYNSVCQRLFLGL